MSPVGYFFYGGTLKGSSIKEILTTRTILQTVNPFVNSGFALNIQFKASVEVAARPKEYVPPRLYFRKIQDIYVEYLLRTLLPK